MKTVPIPDGGLATIDRGDGMPVLLVHGFPLDHTMWDRQIEALARNYRVIAPDLRGFGRSSAGGEMTTMEQFADDLAAILDALNVEVPVVLCGLSMGGYIAFQFWRRHSARLRALALCDTRAIADTAEGAAARLTMAERVLRDGPGFVADMMLPKLFTVESRTPERDYLESTRRVILSTDPRGIAAAARGMAQRPDFTGRLGHISVPTLVLVGSEDALSAPEEMRAIAAAIPGSRFIEIAGAGHMSPLEKPDEVTEALAEFLNAVWEPGTATGS